MKRLGLKTVIICFNEFFFLRKGISIDVELEVDWFNNTILKENEEFWNNSTSPEPDLFYTTFHKAYTQEGAGLSLTQSDTTCHCIRDIHLLKQS